MGLSDFAHPMSMVADVRDKVSSLANEVHRKADSHEINSLRRSLDGLEHSIGQISSEVSELRFELQKIREEMQTLSVSSEGEL